MSCVPANSPETAIVTEPLLRTPLPTTESPALASSRSTVPPPAVGPPETLTVNPTYWPTIEEVGPSAGAGAVTSGVGTRAIGGAGSTTPADASVPITVVTTTITDDGQR